MNNGVFTYSVRRHSD
ncbi:unnamed protein product [Victoria cruziana]